MTKTYSILFFGKEKDFSLFSVGQMDIKGGQTEDYGHSLLRKFDF